ncbi:hypothetical protein HY523_02000 [Candidatus Berkelbacteria bacterium]|nr:hypothetical protein [Candidatus Berkelbacteria bacterium]
MMRPWQATDRLQVFVLLIVCLLLMSLNSYLWQQPFLGLPAALLSCGILGWTIGRLTFPMVPSAVRTGLGILLLLVLLVLVGSLWAEIGSLQRALLFGVLGLLSFLVLVPTNPAPDFPAPLADDQVIDPLFSRSALMLFGGTQTLLLGLLFSARTGDYIYRYWDLLPRFFWPVFGLSAIAFVIVLFGRVSLPTKIVCLSLLTLVIHSALLILGETEYNGDGYRHLASERFLLTEQPLYAWDETDPSRFLYIGSWSLHALLTWMTGLSLDTIHLFFPYLIASLAPILILFAIGQLLFARSTLASLLLATSPLFFYELNVHSMISNPKTLGYVLLLLSMFLALASVLGQRRVNLLDWFVALASLLVYPVSGAFSLLFVCLAVFHRYRGKKIVMLIKFLTVAGFFLLFPVLDSLHGTQIPTAQYLFLVPKVVVRWLTSWLTSSIGASFPILLLFFLILGWLFFRARLRETPGVLTVLLVPLLVAESAFAWRHTLPEQPAFSARIGIPYYVTLLPFLVAGVLALTASARAVSGARRGHVLLMLILPGLVFAGSYQSPATWSISTAELEAIEAIDTAQRGRDYLVLTEEITAAAANGRLGYTVAPYYRYPSGRLFESSMSMIAKPSLEKFEAARQEFQVETIYYLVNPLPPFGLESRAEAEAILPIYGQFGPKVTVFRYPPRSKEEFEPNIEIVPAP